MHVRVDEAVHCCILVERYLIVLILVESLDKHDCTLNTKWLAEESYVGLRKNEKESGSLQEKKTAPTRSM